MEGFGASAPGQRLFEEFKLTPGHVAQTVRKLRSEHRGRNGGEESR
jgi:transketolase